MAPRIDNTSYDVIEKISEQEENLNTLSKSLRAMEIFDYNISDNVEQILNKLNRLSSKYRSDSQLKSFKQNIVNEVLNNNLKDNYVNKSVTLYNYIESLNAYLENKYPMEHEIAESLTNIAQNTQNALSCLVDTYSMDCIDITNITQEVMHDTNLSYDEVIDIINSTETGPILALALDTTISAIQESLNAWKQVEIISVLLKKEKLWFVISKSIENFDLIAKN